MSWTIAPWRRQELPAIIRRARRCRAPLALRDASGIRLTPTVRRRLAPRGETPIPKGWDRHGRITAFSAVTVSPKWRRLGQGLPARVESPSSLLGLLRPGSAVWLNPQ